MKKKLNVGVVVTLSGRWPRELPEKRFKEYGEWTINAFQNAMQSVLTELYARKKIWRSAQTVSKNRKQNC